MREAGDTETFKEFDAEGELPPMASADEDIAACVEGQEHVEAKMAAFRAHRSQIPVDSPFFDRSNTAEGNSAWAVEHYRLAAGVPFPGSGWADDLFAGLD